MAPRSAHHSTENKRIGRSWLFFATLVLSQLISGCEGRDHATSQGLGPSTPNNQQEQFLVPKTLTQSEGIVYALDSNTDTLEVIEPTPSAKELPFEVPPLSVYRRTLTHEYVVRRALPIMARRIGDDDWTEVVTNIVNNQALSYKDGLFVSGSKAGLKNTPVVLLIVANRVTSTWKSVSGIMFVQEPYFVDEQRNILRVSDNGMGKIIPTGSLPIQDVYSDYDYYVLARAGDRLFVVLDHVLWELWPGEMVRSTGLMNVRGASDGTAAWFIGEKDGDAVVACFTEGKWIMKNEPDLVLRGDIASSGRRACYVSSMKDVKANVRLFSLVSGEIVGWTVEESGDTFASRKCIVNAAGKWWISRRDGKNIASFEDNP